MTHLLLDRARVPQRVGTLLTALAFVAVAMALELAAIVAHAFAVVAMALELAETVELGTATVAVALELAAKQVPVLATVLMALELAAVLVLVFAEARTCILLKPDSRCLLERQANTVATQSSHSCRLRLH